MGVSPAAESEQSQPLLAPPPQPSPPPLTPIYGYPVPVPPPYDENPPAYLLLPIYSLPRRRRSRSGCCCLRILSASSSLIAVFFFILLLASSIFLVWPSDVELSIVRLRLDRISIAPHPVASIDIAMGLKMKICNPDVFTIDYSSIVASIFYRGELLGSVTSAGGRVVARGVSYVDADLHLEGVRVLGDVIYFIGDVTKGSVPFDTVTEVQGTLRLFFFDVPVKGKISCAVQVNPDDQTIIHQDCYSM